MGNFDLTSVIGDSKGIASKGRLSVVACSISLNFDHLGP